MKENGFRRKPGRIAIEGLSFFAYHGVYASEKQKGNWFEVDVYIDAQIEKPGETDELDGQVDYSVVYDEVEKIMKQRRNLLESLVMEICERIAELYPESLRICARVSKLNPPLAGKCGRAFVEYTLEK